MLGVKLYGNNENNDWLVRQFVAFDVSDSLLSEKFIPRPDISIIFHFKSRPLLMEKEDILLEPLFATSIISQPIVMNLHGPMDTFVAICKPTVLTRIFGLNLDYIPKRSIDLPHTVFQPLWDKLSQLTTTEERINCFTDFINSSCKQPYCPDTVDLFYDKIIEKGTNMLLKDIVNDCPACRRTLERNFKKRTGVSPKKLMRIVRFDYLWNKIKNENAIDFQDLVFDGNYFDQAHFIKDFKAITGEKPSFFFNRNLQITKMLSGRAEGTIE